MKWWNPTEALNHTGRSTLVTITFGIGGTLVGAFLGYKAAQVGAQATLDGAKIIADAKTKASENYLEAKKLEADATIAQADASVKCAQIKATAKITVADKNLDAARDNLAAEKLKQEARESIANQIAQDRANTPKSTFAQDQWDDMQKFEIPKRT